LKLAMKFSTITSCIAQAAARLARFSSRHSVGAEASALSRSQAVCIRTSFLSAA
jgi:hypothetical protein